MHMHGGSQNMLVPGSRVYWFYMSTLCQHACLLCFARSVYPRLTALATHMAPFEWAVAYEVMTC